MKILITAGPTREYIDSVRFISNASSGLTGYLAAKTAASKGHDVILITGPTNLAPPKNIKTIQITSADQMYRKATKFFPCVDAVIMTAAVGDYKPKNKSQFKQKKSSKNQTLELIPTPDILAELGRRKKNQILIGFALEDKNAKKNALTKFKKKNLDAIILNRPEALGTKKNQVNIYTSRWQNWRMMSKERLAEKIVRLVEKMFLAKTPESKG